MTKIIKIERCGTCPHNGHKGGFGNPAYIPVCRKVDREQPWTPAMNGRMFVARQTVDIPDWCPLEDYTPKGEST